MTASPFALFQAAFPPTGDRIPFVPAHHKKIAKKVPAALAAQWRDVGFGAYGDGLLWMPLPDEPLLDPDDWAALDGTGIEVLRTAFADVCLWQNDSFLWLNVHSGNSFDFAPNVEIVFNCGMTDRYFRKSVLLERMFRRACKRFGKLGPDECFGFAPLPALGGAIAEKYLMKTQMRPYAAMVAQVNG
jgi:hypothetical protein